MTYALPRTARTASPAHTVDIAGSAWPVYKIEALVAGVLVFLGALALTSSLQIAVLGAAAVTVLVWWALKLSDSRAVRRLGR